MMKHAINEDLKQCLGDQIAHLYGRLATLYSFLLKIY